MIKLLPVVNGRLICGHKKTLNKRQKGNIVRKLRKVNGYPTRRSSVKVQCIVCGFNNR